MTNGCYGLQIEGGRKELGRADIMKHLVCVRLLTLFNMLIFTVIQLKMRETIIPILQTRKSSLREKGYLPLSLSRSSDSQISGSSDSSLPRQTPHLSRADSEGASSGETPPHPAAQPTLPPPPPRSLQYTPCEAESAPTG